MKEEEVERINKELRTAKTKKGKKILEEREGKLEEGPKQTLFIKGNKTSENITQLFKDLYKLKKDHSVNYSKRHDIHPFEDISQIEKYCTKNDCGLFMFGSHQKKRPDNLVVGRMFKKALLDMVEVGVENFKSTQFFKDVKIAIPIHSRPTVVFQGEVFETNSQYMQFKNLILDFFVENVPVKSIDLMSGLTHTIIFSGNEEKIYMNTYIVNLDTQVAKKEKYGENEQPLKLEEVGPSCELIIRRDKWASSEQYKNACRRQKANNTNKKRNISRDNFDNVVGRVFKDKQNLEVFSFTQTYMSFKALESPGSKDDKQWLTYWVVFSFLTVFDGALSTVLYFLPAYNFFKMVFYIYLFHPSTRGAEYIFQIVLEPLLTKYESKIDEMLKKGEQKFDQAAAKMK